jgi:glycosyltransferase involved in cell wall biosynthesis
MFGPSAAAGKDSMKILLSAFACCPNKGSEEGVGWGTAVNLARSHRVHVLTTPRHRDANERFLREHPTDRLTFAYFDFPDWVLSCIRHTALWQVYYYCWQRRIASWARSEVESFDPDLIHHVTYGRYWTPSSLWKLGRPLVWGPLGGGDRTPRAFFSCLSPAGRWSERVRNAAQAVAHLDPALRATARHAAVALASTAETEKRLVGLGCRNTLLLPQNAMESELAAGECSFARTGSRFCSVARLLDWKGQALTLRAFARAQIPGSTLVLVGEGRARGRLEALTRELGIEKSVTFLGLLPRGRARQWLRESIALVHPSLHDQAPTVAFEAMSVGTPVIGLALGGITLQVPPDSGILLVAQSPDQAVADLSDAMKRIAADPDLRCRMGEAGRRRVQTEFTWEKKAEQFEAVYRTTLDESQRAGPALARISVGAVA